MEEILKTNIKSLLSENECNKLFNQIKEIGIEKFHQNNSLIISFINQLTEKLHFHILNQFLTIIAEKSILDYEFKLGIKLLIFHHNFDFFNPLIIYVKNKNQIDEFFISQILTETIFNSNYIYNTSTHFFIEISFELIYLTIEKNKDNLSNHFWELVIENSLKINQISYFNNLVLIYPIDNKQYFDEKMWRNIIKYFMNDLTIFQIFELFMQKLELNKNENYLFFENIFNIFIEEITNSYQNIELKKKEEIYSKILSLSDIKIKEINLEKYFEKIVYYKISLDKFSTILIFTCNYIKEKNLIKKMIEKLLKMFYKKGDMFSIYNILKLIKLEVLCSDLKYENIEIDENVLKDLINFLVEHTELVRYEESGEKYKELKNNPIMFYSRGNSRVEIDILENLDDIKFI